MTLVVSSLSAAENFWRFRQARMVGLSQRAAVAAATALVVFGGPQIVKAESSFGNGKTRLAHFASTWVTVVHSGRCRWNELCPQRRQCVL